MQGRWLRAAVAVLVLVALACTSEAPDSGEVDGTGASGTVTEMPEGAGIVLDDRVRLERALGHHTMVSIDAMRATADDAPRRAAARRALRRSSEQLGDTMDAVLSVDAGELDAAWSARDEALLALAAGEDAASDLAAAHEAFGAAVAVALDERLSAADAADLLAEHDVHLAGQLDAHRDDDPATAFRIQREAFSSAMGTAQQLVLAAGAAADATAGAGELRSAMNQLLAEHTWLAVLTARAAVRGRGARQPGAALNGNTEDLTAALLSIYDESVAQAFDERWREMIAALMDFTAAATELDDQARRAAADDLRAATRRAAEQLAEMTEGAIATDAARRELAGHVRRLRRHSIAAANDRTSRTARRADRAYAGSAGLADLMAAGIAEHRPDDFPG